MNVQSILAGKGTDVATIRHGASLSDAAAVLRDRGVGALVVSDDGQQIDGIISERDVVRALAAHGASALGRTVASVMSTDVVTCRPADSVDTQGRLSGIVSIGDVVKSRLGALENENQALVEYLHQGR